LVYQPLGKLHVFLRTVEARAAWRQALQKRGVVDDRHTAVSRHFK